MRSHGYAVHRFAGVQKMLKAHSDREPIQDVRRLGSYLPLHGPQPRVAIRQNGDLGFCVHSPLFHPLPNLAHSALVLVGGECEARAFTVLTQQLAGRDFKMALERLATLPISSIQTDYQRLGRYGARRLGRLGWSRKKTTTH